MLSTEIYITECDYDDTCLRIEIFKCLDSEYEHESAEYVFHVYPGYTTEGLKKTGHYDLDSGKVIIDDHYFAHNITACVSTFDDIFTLDAYNTLNLFNLLDLDYIIRESEPK